MSGATTPPPPNAFIGKLISGASSQPSAAPSTTNNPLAEYSMAAYTGGIAPNPKAQVTNPAQSQPTKAAPTKPTPITEGQTDALVQQIIAGPGIHNPLNSYWQVATHFRLFMTEDIDPYQAAQQSAGTAPSIQQIYNTISQMPQVVIAESGVTGYNITSVDLNSVVGPNARTTNFNVTELTITITEPMGIGFQEAMLAAAKQLGVWNYNKAFLYLELRFQGYDDAGNPVDNPVQALNLPTGNLWIWQIAVSKIDVKIDASGGIYTLHCLAYSDATALDDGISMVPDTIHVEGKTLGEFTTDLAAQLNKSWRQRYHNQVMTYEFVWHPIDTSLVTLPAGIPSDPSQFVLSSQHPQRDSVRLYSMEVNKAGTPTVVMQQGVSIPEMIEAVLVNTEQAQKLAKDNNKTGDSKPADPTKIRKCLVSRIEWDVEVGGYEFFSGQYERTITYHIFPYLTMAPIIDPNDVQNSNNNASVSYDAMRTLIKAGLVKKHYDYIYTGLNNEIERIDIDFSFNYNAEIARLGGADLTVEMVEYNAKAKAGTAPAKISTDEVDFEALVKTIVLEQQQLAHLSKVQSVIQQINGNPAPDAKTAASLRKQLNTLTNNSPPDLTQVKSQISSLDTQLAANKTRLSVLGQKIRAAQVPAQQTSTVYAEQLLTQAGLAKAMQQASPLLISFQQAWKTIADAAHTGTIGQAHRDKSIFANVLGQLYQPQALIQIDMEIRGDPFWLAETNLARMVRLRNAVTSRDFGQSLPAPGSSVPAFMRGDNCMVLSFRGPVRVNDEFVPQFESALTFNGVYRVVKVGNHFSDGTFRQTLSTQRLALIDIIKAAGYQPPPTGSGTYANYNGTPILQGATVTPSNTPAGPWLDSARAKEAVTYFQNNGWSHAQAVGIVANLGAESALNPNAIGDNGAAYGLAQWHPDRQATFKQVVGVPIQGSSFNQQLSFVNWELHNSFSKAGANLQQQTTPTQSAAVVTRLYEIPANIPAQSSLRAGYASQLSNLLSKTS